MTRQRMYGSDNVWGKWVRSLGAYGGPLPSSSLMRGTTINDWDMIVHQYKTPVDNQGTRDVHCLMFVECKTRLATVASSQAETLWFNHQATRKKYQARKVASDAKVAVWHYGVSVLSCEGDDPACAQRFRWGRFDHEGRIVYRDINADTVIRLLAFDCDADTLRPNSFRRHHKVQTINRLVLTPLGLWVEEQAVKRS
jgi:hypothetical protein